MARTNYAAFDPELRMMARILPKGYALHRGLAVPRALMALAGGWGKCAVSRWRTSTPTSLFASIALRRSRSQGPPCSGSTAAAR